MRVRSATLSFLAIGCIALAACAPETDRARYEVGESGLATFRNDMRATLWLGGCGHYDYEKRVGDEWVGKGRDLACVWEGLADPVAPGERVEDPIRAREPGVWRLRYPVGVGCSASQPLAEAHCAVVGEIVSNEFEVVGSDCLQTGCSGQLCAEDHVITTCEWLPHYACYGAAGVRCGRYGPGGSCAFEPTPELAACLEALSGGR
jgi:hypothetical protein